MAILSLLGSLVKWGIANWLAIGVPLGLIVMFTLMLGKKLGIEYFKVVQPWMPIYFAVVVGAISPFLLFFVPLGLMIWAFYWVADKVSTQIANNLKSLAQDD